MINWKDLIDLDSESGILKAIELLKQMDKTLDAMKGASGELREKYKKDADEIYNATVKIIGGFEKVGATSEKGRKQINDNAKAADLMTAEYTAAAKSVGILDTNMKALDEEQKRVKVSTETLNKVYLANQKVMEQRNLQETNLQKTNVKLNLQLQERKKLLKQQAQEELGLIDAYQKESQTLNALRKTYKAVATEYGVGSKQAKALAGEVGRLDQKLKAVDASAGQNQRSVGEYGNAVQGLTPIMGSFGGQIGLIASQLGMIKTSLTGFAEAQKASAAATGASSSALKIFRMALIGTGIGAIVVAIGALVAAFASTQEGADKISKALAPIKGALQGIIGVAQNLALNAFPLIKEKFSAMISNQLLGLAKFRVQWNKLTKDTEGYNEALNDVEKLTKERDESLKKSATYVDNLKKVWNGAEQAIKDSADAQDRFTNLQIELERAQIRSIVPLAKMREEYESLREIAQDQGNTDEKRIKALEEAERVQRKIAATEKDLLSKEIEILELKQSQNDTDREGEKELQELKAKQFEADTAAQKKINSLVSLRSSIEKRAAAERQKALDEEAKRIAEINSTRLTELEAINKRIKKSSEELVQSRIEEEIRLADMGVKLGDDKIQSLEKRIQLEISLERRKSAELIKIKDEELKTIESKRQEELSKIGVSKEQEIAINKKYDDILAQTKEAQKVEIININEDLENKTTEITQKGAQEREQITRDEIKQRVANIERGVSALFDFGNQIGEFASALDAREKQRDEEKFAELEERKEREVALAGENEEAKLNAERKYNEEKAKIEKEAVQRARKIAIFEKTLAVGQAIVSTALGVTKALPNIPLSILVGLLGAAQVATIAATPLPAFAKGTDYAPAGDKIVGELGREMVITPDRKVFLTGDKAEVRTDIPEGSRILTNAITENILANESVDKNEQDAIKISKGASKAHQLSSEIIRQMEAKNEDIVQGFKDAVGGIEVHQWRLGSGGLKKDIRRGNTVYKDVEQENTF